MRTEPLTPTVEVVPGQPTLIQVEVYNTARVIDGVTATLVGLDPEWVELPDEELSLFPNASATLDIQLTLPREFTAGRHTVALEIRSTIDAQPPVVQEINIDVLPTEQAELTVRPSLVNGKRRTQLRATVANRGNQALVLSLYAQDIERILEIAVRPFELTVEPGQEATAVIDVKGRRPVFGNTLSRTINVSAEGGPVPLQSVVTFNQRPLVPRGLVTIMTVAGIVALWVVIFWFGIRALLSEEDDTKQAAENFLPTLVSSDEETDGTDEPTAGETQLSRSAQDEADLALSGDTRGSFDRAAIAGSIAGSITAATDGSPLPRITVGATRVGEPPTTSSVASDEGGAFVLTGLIPGCYALSFEADGFVTQPFEVPEATVDDGSPSCGPGEARVNPGEAVSGLQASLEGVEGSFSGQVVIPSIADEATPPAVSIRAHPQDDPDAACDTEGVFCANADMSGNFELPALPTPASYDLTIESEGFTPVILSQRLDGGEDRVINTVRMTAATGAISGTVTDGAAPLGNVEVTVSAGSFSATAVTPTAGPVGTFLIEGLETPQTYVVSFSAEGFSEDVQAIDVGPGQTAEVTAALVGGEGTVTGLVTSSTGEPLPGVEATITGGGFIATALTITTGPEAGTYAFTGLPTPGAYVVSFTLDGFATETLAVDLAPQGSAGGVNAVLSPLEAEITGTVTSAGSPVGNVEITITDGLNIRMTTTATEPEGTYRVVGLEPNTYTITFSLEGLESRSVIQRVGPGESAAVDIDLPGGG